MNSAKRESRSLLEIMKRENQAKFKRNKFNSTETCKENGSSKIIPVYLGKNSLAPPVVTK